jgi:hypothetical protein
LNAATSAFHAAGSTGVQPGLAGFGATVAEGLTTAEDLAGDGATTGAETDVETEPEVGVEGTG